ncbi:hypothetical protein [Psychromonas aquatilis]|uniref:Holin n=1 Tax=Psychromonas aquatilis TaxID=2005072 RepID=A0ABU9GTC3_9GAMM
MDFASQLIPAVIILFANLLGGDHESKRWEIVTAMFGWTTGCSLILYFIVLILYPETVVLDYLLQLFSFSLLTALSRDYERILKPLFNKKNK